MKANARILVPLTAMVAACAGAVPAVPPVPAPSATSAPTASTAVAAAPSVVAPSAAPLAATPLPFVEEQRAILNELLAVDTSHGHETDALRPIAARLVAAGVPHELVESAPGRGNLVARLKGDGTKRPLLLLAHIDVVPVEGQPWTVPAFTPTEKDGFLYARGVSDDKGMAASAIATLLEAARKKTPLHRDLVVALTAGEETGGAAGARWLVENRRELLDAEFALNEGGFTLTGADFARVEHVAFSSAEKSFQSYRLVVKGKGGHSSVPPTSGDPVPVLARALEKVAAYRFPGHVVPDVVQTLRAAAAREKGPLAKALTHAAATAPRLDPADDAVLGQDRVYNAWVHTTCVTTMLAASPQDNVLPTSAEATVNCRVLPDETREQALATLKKVVGDAAVDIAPTADFKVGPASAADGEVPRAIAKVADATWPGVKVYPSMMTGTSDSRHLRSVGVPCYGIGPVTSFDEARAGRTAHGPDERVPSRWIGPGAQFLHDVALTLAQ